MRPSLSLWCSLAALALAGCGRTVADLEIPDEVRGIRAPYRYAFNRRHPDAYATGAAIHFAHGRAHDVLELTPLADAATEDAAFDEQAVRWVVDPPVVEPEMALWAPHTAQLAYSLFRAIDWTHEHHEQTYDILSAPGLAWDDKDQATRDAVAVYLERSALARSPAPLEVTMRRAAVMHKPYFTLFRNEYPRSNDFFYAAHWWHPAVYEALMLAGNDQEQEEAVAAVDRTFDRVLEDRPERMLLSREIMPRYSRLSPASANIFDNLHMLHGIAYDILAYEGWTPAQKRAELYRVVDAMSARPGDEALAARFELPHPDVDPRVYEGWMTSPEGSMSRIMTDMLREMWPEMSPDGAREVPPEVLEQAKLKMTPGHQPGERPGSLHDALMEVAPGMRMAPGATEPGEAPPMADLMASAWAEQAGVTELPAWPMAGEPQLPPLPPAEE